jgi:transglutaminase-like putative cysteine protease
MKKKQFLLAVAAVVVGAGIAATGYAMATPSADFHELGGEVYDDWSVFRTRSYGDDGFYQLSDTTFRPVIAFESLGDEAALAYEMGQEFAADYADPEARAEALFRFVRDRVRYTPDIDSFGYDEFAQNADELAEIISKNGVGAGDCEDSAVLLAVMCRGAGLRSAIAVGNGHTASLIYLPDYDKTSTLFEINGEAGWVWAEATGSNNPLGWAPKEFLGGEVAVYEISDETAELRAPPAEPATAVAPQSSGGTSFSLPSPFLLIILVLFLLSLRRRRRRRYT